MLLRKCLDKIYIFRIITEYFLELRNFILQILAKLIGYVVLQYYIFIVVQRSKVVTIRKIIAALYIHIQVSTLLKGNSPSPGK